MAFDWADYLELARDLASRSDEASQRTAISRAYYAAFGNASHLLRREGVSFPQQDVHQFVWSEFRNSSDDKRQQIGIDGDRLKRARRAADYAHEFPAVAAVLKSTISSATLLVKELDRLMRAQSPSDPANPHE